MDKITTDYINTCKIVDQISVLLIHSFAVMFSVIFTSWVLLSVVDNVVMHTTSGVAMMIGILLVKSSLDLRDKTIIV